MSDSVFYRKYRPKSFSDIIGQNTAKQILVNSISSNSFSHAYLFTGPRGTGKTSTARIFAKAVNCVNFKTSNDVCNECENCNIYNQNQAVDIIEMDAASNRGIDDIRNLKESVQFMPSIFKKKVYIVDEAHMLSREAFNALLKTLEEPPEHVVFVLATTDAAKLPLTVLSRLLRIDFNLANKDSLTEKLKKILKSEEISFEDSAIEVVVKYAKGSFRDAESILTKLAQENSKITFDLVSSILGVVDETLVESFIQQFESQGKINSEILEQIENTKSPKLFFERLLEKFIAEGGNILIINKILRILFNLDKLDNNSLIIRAFLCELTNRSADNVIRKEEKAPGLVKEIPVLAQDGVNLDKVEIKAKILNDNVQVNRRIANAQVVVLDNIMFPDERTNTIISTSEKYLSSNKIIIITKFKFNLNHLIKPEIKSMVIEQLNQNGFTINQIDVFTEADKHNLKINLVNDSSAKQEYSSKVIISESAKAKEEERSQESAEKISDKLKAQSSTNNDNSDIIEGLLI